MMNESQLKESFKKIQAWSQEGKGDEALALVKEILASPLEPQAELIAEGFLASVQMMRGELDEAKEAGEKALALAKAAGEDAYAAQFEALLTQLHTVGMSDIAIDKLLDEAEEALDAGEFQQAERCALEVLQTALYTKRVDLEASARGMLVYALLMGGKAHEAKGHLGRALEIAETLGDEGALASFQELEKSLASETSLERFQVEADIARQAHEVQMKAGLAMEKDDFDQAIALISPMIELAKGAEAKETEASMRAMLAQSYLLKKEHAKAESEIKKAIAIVEELGGDEDALQAFQQILHLAVGWTPPIQDA